MTGHVTIWWMRQDLRLEDNPALAWAAAQGKVLAVYIDEPGRPLGGASKWWLEQSLRAMEGRAEIVRRRGTALEVLSDLVRETGGQSAVVWNRCYEPWAVTRDTEVKAFLKDEVGVEVHSFNSALLHEPWEVKTLAGTEYKVFTPFWKACLQREVEAPCSPFAPLRGASGDRPAQISDIQWVKARSDDLLFYPSRNEPDWAKGWDKLWEPGELGAQKALANFVGKLKGYGETRNFPAKDATSKLSPHLHFGEIGPRQVWAEIKKHGGAPTSLSSAELRGTGDAEKFLSELGWREFSYHLLWHYPTLPYKNWKIVFDAYPWRELKGEAQKDFEAWTRGKTGYPLVDAGMRELWHTGYMHNRVRMVAASFLIKHLRIDWREGEQWFWDTLVDADGANNAASWQWVAGSGADASPYFRIFNPTAQAERFDGEQAYIKKWVPEVGTGDYPAPIVGHEAARKMALAGYERVRVED